MKVAIVGVETILLPWTLQRGSIEIWNYNVARRLVQTCDVIVYAKKIHQQKKVEYDQGVIYKRISADADRWFTFLSKTVEKIFPGFIRARTKHPYFASSFYHLTYILKVARDLREEKCDIVHIHNFSQFVPIIRAFNPEIKIILHMHCEWLTQLDRAMIERRLREVDLILGCSEHITEKIRRGFPQFAKRCRTIHNGVDIDHFRACQGAKRSGKKLLFVGRISPEKGLHILLDSYKKVLEHYPKAHLDIVGPESVAPPQFIVLLSDNLKVSDLTTFYYGTLNRSYLSYLQQRLLSLKIANNVTFAGFIPHGKIINYYCNADLFVISSLSEGLPLPIIEAMACELPVIATHVGGNPEAVLNGKTGLLVEPGDVNMLAEAIIYILSHEEQRKSMGKFARKRAVELFSWEQIVKNLLCYYKNTYETND